MSELSIDHEFRGDFLIVRLAGRLRPHDAEDFDIEINRIALAEARTIVLDMESLDFIGSSGIGALVRLAKAMDKHELRTRVAAARSRRTWSSRSWRTFSMAMTAWSAKSCASSSARSLKGCTLVR